MAIMGAMIIGAIVGLAASLAGIWLGVWLVRRLDAQATMPVIQPQATFAELEPDAPIRSPDLRKMWPKVGEEDGDQ
jgi:hypothetical protein